MPNRLQLVERVETQLRGRDEGSSEAARCFLRALLINVGDEEVVPEALIERVCEFLEVNRKDLEIEPWSGRFQSRGYSSSGALTLSARKSSPDSVSRMPTYDSVRGFESVPSVRLTEAPPSVRVTEAPSSVRLSDNPPPRGPASGPYFAARPRRRILFLGRSDAARLAMVDAVARTRLDDEAEVRVAALQPSPYDPRALRVLRQSGYAIDGLFPRSVSVDDLAWADVVVTLTGERNDWERLVPRSTPREHESVVDPLLEVARLHPDADALEPFRVTLRAVERLVAARSTRRSVLPVARPVRR